MFINSMIKGTVHEFFKTSQQIRLSQQVLIRTHCCGSQIVVDEEREVHRVPDHCGPIYTSPGVYNLQGHQLYMAVCFWYLVTCLVYAFVKQPTLASFLQGTRTTRPYLSGRVEAKCKRNVNKDLSKKSYFFKYMHYAFLCIDSRYC